MRDILDALESIHTNKKKPMDVKKELNKKPAVMKALSLEDTETNEDKFDGYKIHRLAELQKKVDDVAKDIRLLGKTDAMPDATGAGDLTDQITTMNKAVMMLQDVIERANSIVPDPLKNYDGTPKTEESVKEEQQVEEDCACETELTTNSEEQEMETTKKDTVEVAVEDLARVLELAGLGKEVIKAEAEAEQQAEAEMDAHSADMEKHIPMISKMQEELMDKGMEPEDAFDKACDKYGFDPEDVSEYMDRKNEATEEANTEAPNEVELDEYSNSPDEDYFDADTTSSQAVSL